MTSEIIKRKISIVIFKLGIDFFLYVLILCIIVASIVINRLFVIYGIK